MCRIHEDHNPYSDSCPTELEEKLMDFQGRLVSFTVVDESRRIFRNRVNSWVIGVILNDVVDSVGDECTCCPIQVNHCNLESGVVILTLTVIDLLPGRSSR